MRNFQIINKDNDIISFRKLDKEAANLWNKKTSDKYFTNPFCQTEIDEAICNASSWYSIFDEMIETFPCSWESLVKDLLSVILDACDKDEKGSFVLKLSEKIINGITEYMNYIQPFINLIHLWKSEGYSLEAF